MIGICDGRPVGVRCARVGGRVCVCGVSLLARAWARSASALSLPHITHCRARRFFQTLGRAREVEGPVVAVGDIDISAHRMCPQSLHPPPRGLLPPLQPPSSPLQADAPWALGPASRLAASRLSSAVHCLLPGPRDPSAQLAGPTHNRPQALLPLPLQPFPISNLSNLRLSTPGGARRALARPTPFPPGTPFRDPT